MESFGKVQELLQEGGAEMEIEVFGVGCAKCRATKKLVTEVVLDLQVNAEVVEVSDVNELVGRGVMATPAVFVDGELKSTGRVPLKADVEGWISRRAVNNKIEESCCLYYLQEQARMIKKDPSWYKLTCKGCGKEFSSDVQKDYCFDCEKKRR
jgi:small redox-active disulfide protein 2